MCCHIIVSNVLDPHTMSRRFYIFNSDVMACGKAIGKLTGEIAFQDKKQDLHASRGYFKFPVDHYDCYNLMSTHLFFLFTE